MSHKWCVSEPSRVGEFMKPAAYSVTEQSFPRIVSTSSPVHHLDLRDVASKFFYQLYNQTALSSPSAADNLRSTGRVLFFDGRLQDGNAVSSRSDSTDTAHRMPCPRTMWYTQWVKKNCVTKYAINPTHLMWRAQWHRFCCKFCGEYNSDRI